MSPPSGDLHRLTGERDQLVAERDQLVGALVAAQDRLGAMAALLQVSGESLDLVRLTELMLAEALELTASDYVALHRADEELLRDQLAYDDVDEVVVLVDGLVRSGVPRVGTLGRVSYAVLAIPGSSLSPGGTIGVGRQAGAPYTTGDLRMVETVASAVEQLTRMALLHRESFRRLAIEREHELASALAQAMMPKTPPTLTGVDLFSRCRPAGITGGDLLVLAEIGGTLWFAVGDVAGKGLPAATIMTRAVAAIRVAFLTYPADRPGQALNAVAEELGDDLSAVDSFITLAMGTYTPGQAVVRVASAGHSPVVHVDGSSGRCLSVGASVPPLGVTLGLRPDTEELAFGPGSRLVIGTDGLVEQPGPGGEMRTYEDFIHDCGQTPAASATELGDDLLASLDAHADGTAAADDQTLLVLAPARAGLGGPGPTTGAVTATLELDSDLAAVRELSPWLIDLLVRGGAAGHQGALELALHEISVNVVRHAYDGGPGAIRVDGSVDPGEIRLLVTDQGRAFAPSTAPEPEPAPGVPQVHGRGLAIVRRLVDDLVYTRENGTNSWLLLTRR